MLRALVFTLALSLGSLAGAETIRVAAAVSLKDAISEIGERYRAQTGETVEFTFGSSGQLMGQVRNGAPIDAFISAANAQVDGLIKDNLVDPATRRVIAGNTLVLIVPADSKADIDSFEDLVNPMVERVAAGEPKTVPAGQYAEQVFKSLGLGEALHARLVYGTNVRQVLDYVERGEVAAGVVYATDAKQAGEKVKVVATAAPDAHEPIVYPAVVVTASGKRDAAAKFLEYLETEDAGAVLAAHGFTDGRAAATTQPSATAPAR